MNVTVQFVVDVEITDIFQGRSTSSAFEALDVQAFVFDPYEHAAAKKQMDYTQLVRNEKTELGRLTNTR